MTPEQAAEVRRIATEGWDLRPSQVLPVLDSYERTARALDAVSSVHEPIDALNMGLRSPQVQQVCTGCGTDAGNWQRWPCPTIRAMERALKGDKQ